MQSGVEQNSFCRPRISAWKREVGYQERSRQSPPLSPQSQRNFTKRRGSEGAKLLLLLNLRAAFTYSNKCFPPIAPFLFIEQTRCHCHIQRRASSLLFSVHNIVVTSLLIKNPDLRAKLAADAPQDSTYDHWGFSVFSMNKTRSRQNLSVSRVNTAI